MDDQSIKNILASALGNDKKVKEYLDKLFFSISDNCSLGDQGFKLYWRPQGELESFFYPIIKN